MFLIRLARNYPWPLAAAAVCVGFFAGLSMSSLKTTSYPDEIREFNSKYHYISPLIACSEKDHALSNEKIKNSERKVLGLINTLKSKGQLAEGAMYFRELDGGSWYGVDFETTFIPGSLLKVPLVMSVYKHAEKDPSSMSRNITFPLDFDAFSYKPYFKPQQAIQRGKTYSVPELIKATLVHSDNDAALLLGDLLSAQEIFDSYTHLGVEVPAMNEGPKISVRTYASFFRILYNASYISRDSSEEMLSLMAQSSFREGIVAGVPEGVRVAHKFGEREAEPGLLQLHDCGIVYHDPKPYVLCIMTRGHDFDQLADAIRQLSALVYKEVDSP